MDQRVAKRFGRVLRQLRTQREMSQEALALETDLDRTFISMLERGVRQPTLTTILLLAKTLKIRASEMVRLTESSGS